MSFAGYRGDDLKDGKQFDGFPLRDPRNNTWLGGYRDPFVMQVIKRLPRGPFLS